MSPCLPLVRPAGKVWKRLIYELLILLGNILPWKRIFKVFLLGRLALFSPVCLTPYRNTTHRGCAPEQARLPYGLRAFVARPGGFLWRPGFGGGRGRLFSISFFEDTWGVFGLGVLNPGGFFAPSRAVPGRAASVPVLATRCGWLFGVSCGQVRWHVLPDLRIGSLGWAFGELEAIFECQVVQDFSHDRGRKLEV